MKTHQARARSKGFTLIELLVAMAITVVIVGVLLSITGTAIDTWNRSRNELRAARQAEAIINVMTKDLESLVVRSDRPQEWLSAFLDQDVTGAGGEDPSAVNAARLIFFTAATDRYDGMVGTADDAGGDISCVAYHLEWKDPVSAGASGAGTNEYETFVLSRHLVNPDDTFTNLLGRTNDTDTLDQVYMANYSNDMGESRNFVCENVFQFTMTFHVQVVDAGTGAVSTELVSVKPGSSGDELFQVKHNAIHPVELNVENGVLTAVEISLSVLTDTAIVQLRANPNLPDSDNYEDWVAKNSYSFTRLIQVPRK